MANIVKFSDYRKIKFTPLSYYDYLKDNYQNVLSALQYNDIDAVVSYLNENKESLLYHACLGYSCFESNNELFNELSVLEQPIDLKIVFADIFGQNTRYDIFECAMIAFPYDIIHPAFFNKLTTEDLDISLSNLKNKELKLEEDHVIFSYPENLLNIQNKGINLSDVLLMRNKEDEPVITEVLTLQDHNMAFPIIDLVNGEEANKCFVYLLYNTYDDKISDYLLNKIKFYNEDGKLHDYISTQHQFLVTEETFKKMLSIIDYTKNDAYKEIGDLIAFSNANSKLGFANKNLKNLVEYLANNLKNDEKFVFHKDPENNISLLHYLIINTRLLKKYLDKIDFSDPYVQKEIDSGGYQPIIDIAQKLYVKKENKILKI